MKKRFLKIVWIALATTLLSSCGVKESSSTESFAWLSSNKNLEDFSWEEFQTLDETEQEAFFEHFDAPENFEAWLNDTKPIEVEENMTDIKEAILPWENGGKQPSEYTWDEFQALNETEQEAFFSSFTVPGAFEAWLNDTKPEEVKDEENKKTPIGSWENGGKQPSEYTWDEFQTLSEEEQEAFFASFETPEAFEAWMNAAQQKLEDSSKEYPWENGGKQPVEYTWSEFQSLDEETQEAFFETFDTAESFEAWMNRVTQQ